MGGVMHSDSCRSLAGLAGIREGKAEGTDCSMGGGAVSSGSGSGSGSPMAVSPAAATTAATGGGGAGGSCSNCSDDNALTVSVRGSASSSSSSGWRHVRAHVVAPQPPSPPRHSAKPGGGGALRPGHAVLAHGCSSRSGAACLYAAESQQTQAAAADAELHESHQVLQADLHHPPGCFSFLKPQRR